MMRALLTIRTFLLTATVLPLYWLLAILVVVCGCLGAFELFIAVAHLIALIPWWVYAGVFLWLWVGACVPPKKAKA